MKAYVVSSAGGPDVLEMREVPAPEPTDGWALIRVRAFGVNRSEVVTRSSPSGHGVTFPRVLGLECAGEVLDPGGDPGLVRGQSVIAVMGGMGKDFDGSYAEVVATPVSAVIPVSTSLSWVELASIPMAFGTAWGSVSQTLGLRVGQSILIRGATSSVGMAALTIAKAFGASVAATTRAQAKRNRLRQLGADLVVIDDGSIAGPVRNHFSDGMTVALELVGPSAAVDTAAVISPGGVLCITGFLGGSWDVDAVAAAASAVRVTRFRSGVMSRVTYGAVFQRIIEAIEAGDFALSIDRAFDFDDLPSAHQTMEENRASGKLVVEVT